MMRRLATLFALLLAFGVVAVGCGDDDDDKSGDSDTPAAQTDAGAGAASEDDGADAGGEEPAGTPENVDAAVAQAVEACKQSVGSAPQLSEDVKSDLEELCEEAASGDTEDVQKAAQEVCTKIVEESGVPEGAAKDQALAACDQATASP